jgi:hypothetical protein
MRNRDLYAQILGITTPWHFSDVRFDVAAGNRVEVAVLSQESALQCPDQG